MSDRGVHVEGTSKKEVVMYHSGSTFFREVDMKEMNMHGIVGPSERSPFVSTMGQ